MIILLFISHCGCTAIQLLHTVLTQRRRCWERDSVLQSKVAWVKQYCCVLEKDRGKATAPPPPPLTLHQPLSSFVPAQIQMGLMKV